MKITPEPTPRKVLYPSIVAAAAVTAAAALASCQTEKQQEQNLGGRFSDDYLMRVFLDT